MKAPSFPAKVSPLVFLGAGASVPFGIPAMGKFLEGTWKQLEAANVSAGFAIRRSLELTGIADLEEVMFLLDRLAAMSREDPEAVLFLEQVRNKFQQLKPLPNFDAVVSGARAAREQLRRSIYEKCNDYDSVAAHEVYAALFGSLHEFSTANRLYVITTNYDRIVEDLWEAGDSGLHVGTPALELQTGFYVRPYGNRVLDTKRGYPEPSEDMDGVVHLVKIHGSLGWREYEPGRVEDTGAREYPADYAVLAYPIRTDKSSETPFSELFEALDDALARSNLLILIGTSLRDQAVVGRLADALRTGGKLAVIIDPEPELVRNRLPQDVRRFVAPLEERFVDDFAPSNETDWSSLLERARGKLPLESDEGDLRSSAATHVT